MNYTTLCYELHHIASHAKEEKVAGKVVIEGENDLSGRLAAGETSVDFPAGNPMLLCGE